MSAYFWKADNLRWFCHDAPRVYVTLFRLFGRAAFNTTRAQIARCCGLETNDVTYIAKALELAGWVEVSRHHWGLRITCVGPEPRDVPARREDQS